MHKRQKPPPRKHRANAAGQRNTLRIIGGKWRGRLVEFPTKQGLRPTGDRIRETVFNWLTPSLPGARCLDLFSGSGAMGLEAISRGAASALLVDCLPDVCRMLTTQCELLDAHQQVSVLQADALQWLRDSNSGHFDIVFLDPPFDHHLLPQTLTLLAQLDVVHPGSLIYVECAIGQHYALPAYWHTLRQKQTGNVSFSLLEIGTGEKDSL